MRKIIAGFAISLDGFIEGANGEYDWIIMDKTFDFSAHMKRFDTFLMGRKTYQAIINMQGGSSPKSKHYVCSNTLTQVAKGYILLQGDIKERIMQLKEEEGKTIALFGGASLFASLVNLGVVDEIELALMPIILGEGKSMFGEIKSKIELTLIHSQTLPSGVTMLSYAVKK